MFTTKLSADFFLNCLKIVKFNKMGENLFLICESLELRYNYGGQSSQKSAQKIRKKIWNFPTWKSMNIQTRYLRNVCQKQLRHAKMLNFIFFQKFTIFFSKFYHFNCQLLSIIKT